MRCDLRWDCHKPAFSIRQCKWKAVSFIKLDLEVKFIVQYILYYIIPYIFSKPRLLFYESKGHNSVTVKNRTHNCKFLWRRPGTSSSTFTSTTHEIIFYNTNMRHIKRKAVCICRPRGQDPQHSVWRQSIYSLLNIKFLFLALNNILVKTQKLSK